MSIPRRTRSRSNSGSVGWVAQVGLGVVSRPGDVRLHPAATAVARPVEREHLDAVARRLGDGRAEKCPVVRVEVAGQPENRVPDAAAGRVDAVDLKAHPLRRLAGRVVDVPLDGRALPVARHPPFDPEVTLEALGDEDLCRGSDRTCEQEPDRERRNDSPHRGQSRLTQVTGGNPLTRIRHRSPASSDWKTLPSSVPKTTIGPAAARQAVSMLPSNQGGSPSRQRSKGPSPSSRFRYSAERRPRGPVEADTSTVSLATATARR